MKLAAVAGIVRGQLRGQESEIHGVSIDSRTVLPGQLFVAIVGPCFDGHDFLAQAMERGAAGAIVSTPVECDFPQVVVKDTLQALTLLAAYERDRFQGVVVGLTGSCGKTTAKTLIASVLETTSPTVATAGTLNNEYGVPLTLLRLKSTYHFAVVEMGANHPGEIAKLTHLVKPHVALITNVAPVHIEGFGSLEGIACAKSEIFQGLCEGGVAILNRDDAFYGFWLKRLSSSKVLTFGWHDKSDIRATEIQSDDKGCVFFELWTPAGMTPVHLNLLGEHNVMNALIAAAVGHSQGVALDSIRQGLESAQSVDKRLVSKKGIQGIRIIDDSYNANPQSVKAAMQVLSKQQPPRILVVGDMLELGDQAEHYHRELGQQAMQYGIDSIYCFGDLTRHTAASFKGRAFHYDNHDMLIQELKESLLPGCTVLVKGSNSMKMWLVSQALTPEKDI